MEILIHDGKQRVILRSGDRAFELCEPKKRGDEIGWEPVGFYTDLNAAFNAILKRKVLNSEAASLEELKRVIQEARAEITEVWGLNRFGKAE